ncbi:CHAT domain-containing protein [Penicillium longicatenatum]|nr:CHAT domain-containing protein [Penicillium longicatenatum]
MTIHDATVERYERPDGSLHPETLEAAYKLGIDHHDKGNILAAESHLLRASKGYEETCGLHDSRTLDALEYLGITYRKLVKLNEAEATHNRVVEARTAMSGPDHTTTLIAQNRLAMVYRAQGRLDEAEGIYRRVWETFDKTMGPNDEATLRASISLGNIAFNRKNFTEAGEMYASALSRYETVFGTDHPSTQQAASNLAAVRIHQKRYSEAETILLTIVRQITKSQGLKSVRLLPPWLNLSCAYDGQQKYDEAQKTLSSILRSYEDVYGPSHSKTLGIIRRKAIALAKQEKLTEAIEIIQKGIGLSSHADGYPDDAQIQLMISLAGIFDQQGRFSEAQQIHHQLTEKYENRFGENHDWTIRSLQNEAEMIFKQEKYTEAELAFQNATERCKKAFGAEDERTLWNLMGQCHAACGCKEVASVESDIWLLFAKCDEFPSLQNGRAILVFQHLSKNCVFKHKFKEAESLMTKVYEICLKFFDRGHPVTISYGLQMDKVRRQLWQHEKGHPVDISTFPNTKDRTPDAIIDILEFTTALSVKPADESAPLPSRLLANLALSYGEKWEESRDPRYLDIGIDKLETAILVGNEDDELRLRWLDSLGVFYRNRFRARNTLDDLRKAIEFKEKAVNLQDKASPDHPKDLSALSMWLIDLYERDSTSELLDRGIKLGEEVLIMTNSDDSSRPRYLHRQGMAFLLRHELNGEVMDLERSFELIEAAMSLTAKSEPHWKLLCSVYADLFRHRFKLNGKIEDLEEAVRRVQAAIHEEPEENHILLESLARELEYRYMALGSNEDLDEAIKAAERAVELGYQDQENQYQADNLMRLGYLLVNRFDAKGHQEDLDRAIMHLEKARNTQKTNANAQARCLSGLAGAFRSRWKRTGDKDGLEAAIDHERLALDLLPNKDVGKLDVMNNLANNLIDKFKDSKNPSDMEEVIDLYEMVLSLRPSTHMHYPGSLNNFANALEARFNALKNIEDLNLAIENSEKALSIMHADDPSRAGYSSNLGARYYARYLEKSDEKDLISAVNHRLHGWRVVNGLPFDRVLAGSQAVYRLRDLGRFDEATTIAMEVVNYLPQVTTRSLQITDQQYVVREFSGIAGNACSLLLRAGRLQDALEYLEKGRTVILDLLMSSRVDLTELESASTELASRFRKLQDEINQTFNPMGMSPSATEGLLQKRLASVSQFNECVEVIRSLPGQTQFLLGPNFETIRSGAKGEFIIVVNITTTRSDAIIISDEKIDSLEIPDLSRSRTLEWLEKDLTRKAKDRAGRKRQNEEYTSLLHWLWVSGVKPIFDRIKLHSQPSTETRKLPRVCWIGSGVASMLPFHAACDRTLNSESTFSYAISSYSPSIKTMLQVRAKLSGGALGPNPSLLMVGMPTTRGHAPLSGVEDEIEEIIEEVEPTFSVKSLLHPQPASVLSHLASYDMVHFACHALSDSKNPLNGHLMLEPEGLEASDTGKCGALTVETIVQMDLKRARIAYLSACSTAENRATKLLDEAIHLVSGFQVAGFAHVLGTMWPAPDLVSRDVAVGFYQNLAALVAEPGVDSGRAVAEAFHLAVKEVRSEFEDQPLFWAQFVHFGG